jgi:energy-converting hydrogenase A subunit R
VKKVFISDCEGPISKNDNAFEITSHFIPDGSRLFAVISKYDDVLAGVLKRPNHEAGDTLKLVLPFFKAYDVTDRKMREFSAKNLILIANVKDTLNHVKSIADVFIVSTSYEHYIRALCQTINFPYKNTYCTRLNIDKYELTEKEKTKLKQIAEEIIHMPLIEIPQKAESIKDFTGKNKKIIQRLDEIFWSEMQKMDSRKILTEVNPVGGSEKAEAIRDATQKVGATLTDVMYVGDSITDVEAFKLVKDSGGLAVSFNGNQYAIKNAEIAVLSENSIATAVIADVFCKFGRQQTLRLVEKWSRTALIDSQANKTLLNLLFQLYHRELPKAKIIKNENMEILAKESAEFRKKVRGKAIGRLG